MTAPYRTPEASLRAEVERLTRELATMRSPAPTRWRVRWSVSGESLTEFTLFLVCCADAAWAFGFVAFGASSPYVARGSLVCAVVTIAWALAFVRRVPVDGGGE